MLVERLSFRAKYGRGDELMGLFRELVPMMRARGYAGAVRLYTDVTGPFFSCIVEQEHADVAGFASQFMNDNAMFAEPEFQAWFGRMVDLVETGDRQLLTMEQL